MPMNKRAGFTLIELLVVIAIIGILSAIVLTSLATSRGKAKDAAIASELNSLRSNAELFALSNSYNYGATSVLCDGSTAGGLWADATVQALLNDIDSLNGARAIGCDGNNLKGAAYAVLNASGVSQYWCVDSSGTSKNIVGGPPPNINAQACP